MSGLLATLLRRALRVLLRASTGPVEALLYADALAWAIFLALVPPTAYAHIHAIGILAVKGAWVWPAALAVALPPASWVSDWEGLHRASRFYKVGWWTFLALATLLLAPSVTVFWLPAAANMLAALWLVARGGADDVRSAR